METVKDFLLRVLDDLDSDSIASAKSKIHEWIVEFDRKSEDRSPDLNKCPGCGGPADNGHDRCLPPSPYYCTTCESKVVGGANDE